MRRCGLYMYIRFRFRWQQKRNLITFLLKFKSRAFIWKFRLPSFKKIKKFLLEPRWKINPAAAFCIWATLWDLTFQAMFLNVKKIQNIMQELQSLWLWRTYFYFGFPFHLNKLSACFLRNNLKLNCRKALSFTNLDLPR